jgi:hypothetical protein
LFLLKIERAERPLRGLTATEGDQTASYCNFCGVTAMEGSQTANLYIAHSLTVTKAGQTASTSNGLTSNFNVAVTIVMVRP